MRRDPVTFFGVPLARETEASLEMRLGSILDGEELARIATPNPEMLVAAKQHASVRKALLSMDVRIPDGFGLSVLAALTGQGSLQRHTGVDVLLDLCRLGAQRKQTLLLLGGWGATTETAAEVLRAAFPGLQVEAVGDVAIRHEDNTWQQPKELIGDIASYQPDILAVALGGAGYKRQERWIAEQAPAIPGLKIAIGVGGAFDMIAGKRKRAPKLIRRMGLEWLWRLILQPSRLNRILTATVRFPILAIFDRLRPSTDPRMTT